MKGPYAHTGTMSRFILKRDRLRILIWIFALATFTWLVAISFETYMRRMRSGKAWPKR